LQKWTFELINNYCQYLFVAIILEKPFSKLYTYGDKIHVNIQWMNPKPTNNHKNKLDVGTGMEIIPKEHPLFITMFYIIISITWNYLQKFLSTSEIKLKINLEEILQSLKS
jgi:hypothetical protein